MRESIAFAFHDSGDVGRALAYLRDAVADPGASLRAKAIYARIATPTEQATALDRLASTDITREPDIDALGAAGSELALSGRYTDAMPFLERAAALDPSAASRWAQLGFTHLQLGQFGSAKAALARAVALSPRDATLLGGLAAAECGAGNRDEAQRHALGALALDPNEPTALRVTRYCVVIP